MSQSMSTSRRLSRRLALLAALAATMLTVGVASASAAQITSVTPNPVVPPKTLAVEGIEFGAYEAEDIRLGICTEETFFFVPACGVFSTDVAIDGAGVLTASLAANSAAFTNLHGKLPGQPASFNCEEVVCGVLAAHHPSGGSQTVLDFEPLTFE